MNIMGLNKRLTILEAGQPEPSAWGNPANELFAAMRWADPGPHEQRLGAIVELQPGVFSLVEGYEGEDWDYLLSASAVLTRHWGTPLWDEVMATFWKRPGSRWADTKETL